MTGVLISGHGDRHRRRTTEIPMRKMVTYTPSKGLEQMPLAASEGSCQYFDLRPCAHVYSLFFILTRELRSPSLEEELLRTVPRPAATLPSTPGQVKWC